MNTVLLLLQLHLLKLLLLHLLLLQLQLVHCRLLFAFPDPGFAAAYVRASFADDTVYGITKNGDPCISFFEEIMSTLQHMYYACITNDNHSTMTCSRSERMMLYVF
ncbi:hypothetical protein BC940DRAFT_318142 [Gongronella butleri]|nr:hypothetical protein BC940DRAFT_318142 [Gongronella butleri]